MYDDVVDDVKDKGYVAVSHVWGNQQMFTADELGVKGGVDWMVPLSNSNKIHRLVDAMDYYEKEYCWWDILCMQQDKQDEINKEIPYMGNYYSGAEVTLVLSDMDHDISDDCKKWYTMVQDVVTSDRDFTETEQNWILSSRRELVNFSEDQWFTRVWTLQETVLSNHVFIIGIKRGFNLLDLLFGVWYTSRNHPVYSTRLFGKSNRIILDLADAIYKHRNKDLTLRSILSMSSKRNCYKIHDRIYGILGILGYKDIIIDYKCDIRDLNKVIVQYSYSKGDISWISIGEGFMSFVQPMYENFISVGEGWKEDYPDSCNISFQGGALYMDIAEFATVTYCTEFKDASCDRRTWIVQIIMLLDELGYNASAIYNTLFMYSYKPDENRDSVECMERFINYVHDTTLPYDPIYSSFLEPFFFPELSEGLERLTIAEIEPKATYKKYPLVILGQTAVGDKIVTLRIHDHKNRRLGIVLSNSYGRRGVCIIPPIDTPEVFYDRRKFIRC
jgi:hypothetical protein